MEISVDLSQVRIRMRDITFAGYCGDGARRWFVTHGIDLHDFMANGMAADEFIRRGDHLAEDVVRKKLEREHHG